MTLTLHPQYRLLLLLCSAVTLPMCTPIGLLGAHGLLLWACVVTNTLSDWFKAVLRLKWLLISIVVLYGWFTPGMPVWPVAGVNMPTAEGLGIALERFAVLSALVAAVMSLVKPLNSHIVALSLARLLMPLRYMGINVNIFSQRLALTLAAVSHMQKRLQARKNNDWLDAAGETFVDIEQGGDAAVLDQEASPLVEIKWADNLMFICCLAIIGLLVIVPELLP